MFCKVILMKGRVISKRFSFLRDAIQNDKTVHLTRILKTTSVERELAPLLKTITNRYIFIIKRTYHVVTQIHNYILHNRAMFAGQDRNSFLRNKKFAFTN